MTFKIILCYYKNKDNERQYEDQIGQFPAC